MVFITNNPKYCPFFLFNSFFLISLCHSKIFTSRFVSSMFALRKCHVYEP